MLEKALSEKNESVQRDVLYSLVFFYVNSRNWEKTDWLFEKFAENDEIKSTIFIHAFAVSLISKHNDDKELISRLVSALTDKSKEIRDSVAEILGKAKAELNITASKEAIKNIVCALEEDEKRDNILEYLYYFSEIKENAELLLTLLKKVKSDQKISLLIKTCEEVLNGKHIRSCNICKYLPRHKYYESVDEKSKKLLLKLYPKISEETTYSLSKCPECGNYYKYSYSYEYESPFDGGRRVDTTTLERLAPTELLKELKGMELEQYKADYERIIEKQKSNLFSLERYIREDAARALELLNLTIDQNDFDRKLSSL